MEQILPKFSKNELLACLIYEIRSLKWKFRRLVEYQFIGFHSHLSVVVILLFSMINIFKLIWSKAVGQNVESEDDEAPEISKMEAIIWLAFFTGWIAVLSEYLVQAIEVSVWCSFLLIYVFLLCWFSPWSFIAGHRFLWFYSVYWRCVSIETWNKLRWLGR